MASCSVRFEFYCGEAQELKYTHDIAPSHGDQMWKEALDFYVMRVSQIGLIDHAAVRGRPGTDSPRLLYVHAVKSRGRRSQLYTQQRCPSGSGRHLGWSGISLDTCFRKGPDASATRKKSGVPTAQPNMSPGRMT
ncbi:hypothetical protein BGZ61DRAFT_485202 [Ilyonectria robusta]|uniref:uncharacterized protein n=1 Tax=Ilyonectria robusta TaxID=1079257 RepID=UPI001E8D9055|nr:uncharacterized protein BGZ61DRAFT_485202 [Ilyonectria robusta]KAH8662744.1 hypothetical protein BGZ61DRAFT_485202 [Ilyonectria robusta]